MKNLFFYFVPILLISCSTDEVNERTYSITIEQQCRGAKIEYCVSEATRQGVSDFIYSVPSDPCVWVSFKDLNGHNRSGFFRSSNGSTGARDCI